MDWDIHRLFALDSKIYLTGAGILFFVIFGVLNSLAIDLNAIENDPSYNVDFLGILSLVTAGVLILGSVLIKLTRGLYNYLSIKYQVIETIEKR